MKTRHDSNARWPGSHRRWGSLAGITALIFLLLTLLPGMALAAGGEFADDDGTAATAGEPIPWSELGEHAAGLSGHGDALEVTATPEGASLRTDYQQLRGEVTARGLRLQSGAEGADFAVRAASLGRMTAATVAFASEGAVEVDGDRVRWLRPGVTEEYFVSVDGVRQDFVLHQRPAGDGELVLELALEGVRAEPAGAGARLKIEGSGRTLAYQRLEVSDAHGRALPASMVVTDSGGLAITVADAGAAWPIRIDPTFSNENWRGFPHGGGVDAVVFALAPDGNGGVYVGGGFEEANGKPGFTRIAHWDGNDWSALGGGLDRNVLALLADGNGGVYAGGSFDTAGGETVNSIAHWDPNTATWSALGDGVGGGGISALLADGNGGLYAGGRFDTAGGVSANNIAHWDGSTWSALGDGTGTGTFPDVNALALDGSGGVYAGGTFTTTYGAPASYIAHWDGTTWSPLGDEWDHGSQHVRALLADGSGGVYVGGTFSIANGAPADYIAHWDGSTWSALGDGVDWRVYALAPDGSGGLYAGGRYGTNYIAHWDPDTATWSVLGDGVNDTVEALLADGSGGVYAGGYFDTAGGAPANAIAHWDGSAWSIFGGGVGSSVFDLAPDGNGGIYAGGWFTTAGGAPANHIAHRDGSAWSALGEGVLIDSSRGPVHALLVDGNGGVYAGGYFDTADGETAHNIAHWDPNTATWSALGSGVNGMVRALASDGNGGLYAGGWFTAAGGASASYIAHWDPDTATWSPLGSGLDDDVEALLADGNGGVYAGGDFTAAGGASANRIAHWDPNTATWSALGDDQGNGVQDTNSTDAYVKALALDGNGGLYAGGKFNTAGSVSAIDVAHWNGSAWSALGSGTDDVNTGEVEALAPDGNGGVYAGGEFTTAGGEPANRIAHWDGTTWSPLGDGVNDKVYALARDANGVIHAGGTFDTAGGQPAERVALIRPEYALSYAAGENGTVTGALDQTVLAGGDGTEVTAVPNADYAFTGWSDGVATASRTETGVAADLSVTASFAWAYTVTPLAGAGGSIDPDTPQTVGEGSTTSYTVTPDDGYSIDSVTGCGGTLNGTTYTTGPVSADCTVEATFALKTGDLQLNINPAEGQWRLEGEDTWYTSGHTLSELPHGEYNVIFSRVPGWNTRGDESYLVHAEALNAYTVEYTENSTEYQVSATTADANGTVEGSSTYVHNARATLSARPEPGYAFSHWTENGQKIEGAGAIYEFYVTADRSVAAHFRKINALPGLLLLLD
ncbi:MAG: hypothetical protein U5L07_14675 [Desulfobacterales bacterium]|nr:hypothetical protein [Desulfobacterales bacterium]